jgi:hypothetical protein
MTVRLVAVTADTRQAVAAVQVTEEQRANLDTQSFADFLAGAPLHPTFDVYSIHDGD